MFSYLLKKLNSELFNAFTKHSNKARVDKVYLADLLNDALIAIFVPFPR